MNKTGIINTVSEKLDITKKEATLYVETVFETVLEGLVEDKEVVLGDLGKLQVVERSERKARNPQDGSEVIVPAKNAPKYKPSKKVKEAVL